MSKKSTNLPLWIGTGLVGLVIVAFFLLKDSNLIPGSVVSFGKAPNISSWQVITNTEYGFQLKYPAELQAVQTKGTSDLMGRFLVVDLGTAEELDALRRSNEAAGAGASALFLRLIVAGNSNNDALSCGEFVKIRDFTIDGEKGILCGGKTMVSDHAVMAMILHEEQKFVFESGKYTEPNKAAIDGVIQSLTFQE